MNRQGLMKFLSASLAFPMVGIACLVGCAEGPAEQLEPTVTDAAISRDAHVDPPAVDHGPPLDGGQPDAARDALVVTGPVDCDEIAASQTLCEATENECRFVTVDGADCATLCRTVGFVCRGVYEDVPEACAPDIDRPALGCDPPSGHDTDFCICARDTDCNADCTSRTCGLDGCGGLCGSCLEGQTCRVGNCIDRGPSCDELPYNPQELLSELEGFGRRTTGGNSERLYRVTNTRDEGAGSLRRGLESDEPYWIVFDIGEDRAETIDLGDDPVRVRSRKTVDGRGRNITIDGGIEFRSGVRNVIFTDLTLTNSHGERCGQSADVISIIGDGADSPGGFENRDLWFHHLDMYDGGDGLIDIRGGSRITISWCHFHDHAKAMLFSMVNTDASEGREMEVTVHHNFFDRISRRSPELTRGRVHLYNNYNFHWWEFAAASVVEAQLFSENNIYEARPGLTCGSLISPCQDPAPCGDDDYWVSKVAISNDWAADQRGKVRSSGDLLLNDATIATRNAGGVFTPSYDYSADPAGPALADLVRNSAGPRTSYCAEP